LPIHICQIQARDDLDCLAAAPSERLQNASGNISEFGLVGTFAFLPAVDGDMTRERPLVQLQAGQISARRILVGLCIPTCV
jgi:carboxylesterase type B